MSNILSFFYIYPHENVSTALRDCALAPVATGGEPLSRPSFPGARFPGERRRRRAFPWPLCTTMYIERGARDTRMCALCHRKNRERNFSSLLCHHTWWPRCRLLSALRRDAMFSHLPSRLPSRLLHFF